MYKLGDEKNSKMASVRDVRHERDPGNVGEVKLPTIWTDEKQSREERLEERRVEEKESEERRCRCAKR